MTNKTLRELANKRKIYIGAGVNPKLLETDRRYSGLLEKEFNMMTPENAMKFWAVHPSEKKYTFKDADILTEFAQKNRLQVRGHALVWHKSIPDWVKTIHDEKKIKNIFEEHIREVAGHFKKKLYCWDVINEAFADDASLDKDSFWLNKLGPEYLELAFRIAHQTDQDAKLFYNEWGIETINQKSNAVYRMAKDFVKQGVPLHGIGFQMHVGLGKNQMAEDVPEPKGLAINLKRFSDLGLEVHITEMDVQIQGLAGTQEEKFAAQAKVYGETLATCLQIPNFRALVQWGVTDKFSWIPAFTGKPDAPLIFDENYSPKPAYFALTKALA